MVIIILFDFVRILVSRSQSKDYCLLNRFFVLNKFERQIAYIYVCAVSLALILPDVQIKKRSIDKHGQNEM